ncbi:transglycosylase domain-containing protein [Nocardiopsis mangrovi]|uniref:Transglycosylase domain-containing protein n=1 Tax=Nocardiopsis mangrovi TaxID=1179818 RepID=A0ABV9DYA5_9ACTN
MPETDDESTQGRTDAVGEPGATVSGSRDDAAQGDDTESDTGGASESAADDDIDRTAVTAAFSVVGGTAADVDDDVEDTSPAAAPEPAAEATGPAAASAFKDSGTFFRERVARTLAEQGFDFREDGTWGDRGDSAESAGRAAAGDRDDSGSGGDGASASGDDASASSSAPSVTSSSYGSPNADASAPATASADAGDGAGRGSDDGSDREALSVPEPATTAFDADETLPSAVRDAPVSSTHGESDTTLPAELPSPASADDSPSSPASPSPVEQGSAGHSAWDPEGTAAFTPVFDDDDDDEGDHSAARGQGRPAAGSSPGPTSVLSAFGPALGKDAPAAPDTAPGPDRDVDSAAASGGLGDGASRPGSTAGEEDSPPASPRPANPYRGPGMVAFGAGAGAAAGAAASAGGSGAPPAGPGTPGGPGSPGSPGGPAGPGGTGTGGPGDGDGGDGDGGDEARSAAAAGKSRIGRTIRRGRAKAAAAASASGPKGPDGPTGPGGKKPKKPKKPLWWRITRGGLITVGAFALLGIGGFGIAYATIPVPDSTQEGVADQATEFYFSDGETKFAERGIDREIVDLDEIPDGVQEAVISAEDRGFWTEPGVSLTGTIRGAWSTFTGQQVQGGSTITQQLVRNYFEGVSRDQTVARKLQEIIIALKVDQSPDMDKEWVMEQYLNTIYFGRNAYGIQAAAGAYYHKDVSELTAEESAFLAAAIQQPTPFGEADSNTTPEMEERWRYVVNGMVGEAITEQEAAAMEFPHPEPERITDDLGGYTGYMLQQAMAELGSLGYTEDQVNRGGYKVITTFDQDLMDMARDAVESTVDVDSLPEGVQAGLTAIDPATGEVVAFYGGTDYNANQYDSAFNGSAQSGSAFKPYVLATALEQGYSLDSVVNGSSPITVNGSQIQNAGGANYGPLNLVQATQRSINTGYVQLAQEVGVENVRETAYAAGIPENMITDDQVVPTLALGVSDVSPVDQASGYATFANGGEHIQAHVVREIVNRDGEDEREPANRNQAVSADTAANVSYALQQVVQGGTGSSAALPDGRPVAGKTGTTDSSVATWFVGYAPQLSTAVGVYNGNNQPFSVPGWGSLSGGTLSASIWRAFMSQAMEGREVEQFPGRTSGGDVQNLAPELPPSPEVPEEPVEPPVEDPPSEVPPPETPEVPEVPSEPDVPPPGEEPPPGEWPEFPGPENPEDPPPGE